MPDKPPSKKLIIDKQLAHGLGEDILDALSQYFKLGAGQLRVRNDDISPEHTLIDLLQVKRAAPHIKLRLQELSRFQRTDIHYKGSGEVCDIELRIEDETVVAITKKILAGK